MEPLSSAAIEDLSALHALWWLARGGGLASALWTTFRWRLRDGAQGLADALAAPLPVRLGHPVIRIEQDGEVRAYTADGHAEIAQAAVLALAPGTPIAFDPPLPSEQAAIAELSVGPGTKIVGRLTGAVPRHRTMLGGAPLAGAWRLGRRVTGFAIPPHDSQPPDLLIADLAAAFDAQPDELAGLIMKRWDADPWIIGCDVAFRPGQLSRLGPLLQAPWKRIAFAGAERSSWPNNLEGALESGERAARQLLPTLA